MTSKKLVRFFLLLSAPMIEPAVEAIGPKRFAPQYHLCRQQRTAIDRPTENISWWYSSSISNKILSRSILLFVDAQVVDGPASFFAFL